jgi:hypothetical protein
MQFRQHGGRRKNTTHTHTHKTQPEKKHTHTTQIKGEKKGEQWGSFAVVVVSALHIPMATCNNNKKSTSIRRIQVL